MVERTLYDATSAALRSGAIEREVSVRVGRITLDGDLIRPPGALGVVLFAHGSASSRHSAGNRFIADALRRAGFAALLFDMLTPTEEAIDAQTERLRFDVDLLADRLIGVVEWVEAREDIGAMPVGLFGASTGAAGALMAAGHLGARVAAIVSRGGRPDLAGRVLPHVVSPTLLIAGTRNDAATEHNREAFDRMRCEKELHLVAHATDLFEEPSALDEVMRLTTGWFAQHLRYRR